MEWWAPACTGNIRHAATSNRRKNHTVFINQQRHQHPDSLHTHTCTRTQWVFFVMLISPLGVGLAQHKWRINQMPELVHIDPSHHSIPRSHPAPRYPARSLLFLFLSSLTLPESFCSYFLNTFFFFFSHPKFNPLLSFYTSPRSAPLSAWVNRSEAARDLWAEREPPPDPHHKRLLTHLRTDKVWMIYNSFEEENDAMKSISS